MKTMTSLRWIVTACTVLVLAACSRSAPPPAVDAAAAGPALKIESPWVRATPPGADAGAAYATLRNDGGQALRITGVATPVAGEAMLHSMSMENGVMQMRMLDALDVPAHGVAVLAPGGNHLMLMGLKQPLTAGSEVTINFTLADGQQVSAVFPVREDAP